MNIVQQKTRDVPQITYRKINALNQSMIGLFDDNPVQFYEEYILGNKRKDKISKAMAIGSLTDFYLLDCKGDEEKFEQSYSDHFNLYEGTKGSGQAYLLADYIFEVSQRDANENGKLSTKFEDRFAEAFTRIQTEGKYSKKTPEWALNDFISGEAFKYFKSLVDNMNKTTVDMFMMEKAKFLTNQAMTDPWTSEIFNNHSEYEDLRKFPIEFTIDGFSIPMKAEIDQILIDHKKMFIYPKDLKCSFDNEMFEYSYLKRKYYLQDAFYFMAIKHWAKLNGMEDYHIQPFEFIVLDTSKNARRPLRYVTTDKHVKDGLGGFIYGGYKYRGIIELIDEISWASENGIWNVSKQAYDNEGVIPMKIFDDGESI